MQIAGHLDGKSSDNAGSSTLQSYKASGFSSEHPYEIYNPYGHSIGYSSVHHETNGYSEGYKTGGQVEYYEGSNADEIPFDIYNKGYHHGGVDGIEYSYAYPNVDNESHNKHQEYELSHKALLAKSFLIPLASAAVLGIAAALFSNPLLLQLGTVSGVGLGKRKKRALHQGLVSRLPQKLQNTLVS